MELEQGKDGYYRIITAYPKSDKKIEGILIFDDTPHSSPVTATGSLPRLTNDESGVSNPWGNAKISTPSDSESVSQTENNGNKNIAKNIVDAAVKNATKWTNDHVILNGFSPEFEQGLRNEIIKRTAATSAVAAVDELNRKQNKPAEKTKDDSEKLSASGNISTKIGKIIDAENLSSKQAAISEFGNLMGVPVKFFRGNKKFHGAFRNGEIYLNADAETSHDWTFWHESFHWLASNNPALYKEIADALNISQKQIEDYRKEIGRENLSNAETIEEILADNMKDTANRAGLLQQVGKKNKSLLQRFISWLKSVMDRFTDFFNTPKNGLTREQKNKMYDAFGKMARSITDANGNAIFRFNNRTKNIELANGEKLVAEPVTLNNLRYSVLNDSELDSSGRFKNPYAARKELQEKLNPLRGVPIKNKSTGIVAQFGNEGVKKLVSDKAVNKSLSNGYTEKQHYVAAMNIKQLYEDAVLSLQRPDRDNDPNIKDVKYFDCPTEVLGENAVARIMAKNTLQHGHHIYTLELQELNKPAELENQAVNDSSAGSKGSTLNTRQDSTTDAEKPSIKNITQTENDGNTKFSINLSDNSAAAFAKKISNKFFGERSERFRKLMKESLEDLTGYKISSGHLATGDIAVKPNSKVIRTKSAYDWENILPEVGKIVAGKLNLQPTTEMQNYIASWIIDGAPNNNSPESKEFQRAMRNAADDYRDKLFAAQNKFIEWNNKSAMEKAQAIISSQRDEKSLGEKVKNAFNKGYEEFFEDIAPVKKLIAEIEKETGKKISDSLNPYIALRNYKGMAGRAKMMLEGDEISVKVLQETYPNIDFKGFKTLQTILKEVGATKDDKVYDEFKSYVTACHVKELHEHNIENAKILKDQQDILDALQENLDNAKTKKQIAEIEKRIKLRQDKIAALQRNFYYTPLTESECDEIISQNKNRYGKSQKDLVRYSNTLLAIIHDAGLRSDFVYAALLKKWNNYVPLHRLFDENENLAFGDSLKTMEGSARDIIDPIQAIIHSTNAFIKRAEKNKAKILLAGLVRCNGVGNLIEEIDGKKPDDRTVITFFEGGVKKYLQTDPAVVHAVNNMTTPQINWFFKFLRLGTTIVRNFMTIYNPNFALRNLMRDPQDAYLYSGKHDRNILEVARDIYQTPMYVAKGIMHALKQDEIFNEWMIHGGAQASFWSMDRDYAQNTIDKLTRKNGKNLPPYQRIKNAGAKVFNFLQAFGEYSELGTRIGHYEKVKNILAQKHGGKNTYDDLVTAAFESRDLMDFARGGAASRHWNIVTAFANANLQGIDKFLRTFNPLKLKNAEGRKEFGYSVLRLMISSILPTVILFALNHDKDWYKNDLNDWERRANWVVGESVRIPKGMDFGIRFTSNFVEDALNYAYNKQPFKFKKTFTEPIIDELPDMFPTMLQPLFECAANYDLFTRNPIVPRRLENLPEPLQYDSRTLGIAKYIGEVTGYSPKKVEHLLFGFTGNLGKGFFKVGDVVLGDKKASIPAADWVPIVGSFSRVPYRNPKIVNDYYEQLDEQTKLHNEFKLTGKKPEGYDDALYNRFKKIQKDMQKFSKLERAAIENLNISEDERDNRRVAIQKKRIALIEKVLR